MDNDTILTALRAKLKARFDRLKSTRITPDPTRTLVNLGELYGLREAIYEIDLELTGTYETLSVS